MEAWRRSLRHARRVVVYGVAVMLILLAVVVGLANRLLPLVERHPERIAAWLSERAGRPVAFDRVAAAWTRRGPLLTLEQLRIGEAGQALEIARADLLIAVYSGLLPNRPLTELRLRGLPLDLTRDTDGRWQAQGLAGADPRPDQDPLAALDGLGEIQVREASLRVRAPDLGLDYVVPRVDLRLRSARGRISAGLMAWLGEAPPITAVAEFERGSGDGRLYVGSEDLRPELWSTSLRIAGIELVGAGGPLDLWLDLQARRVVEIRAEADLAGVALRGMTPIELHPAVPDTDPTAAGTSPSTVPAAIEPRAGFDRLTVGLRWQPTDEGWRLQAPLLRVDADGDEQVLDGLYAVKGATSGVSVRSVELRPLAAFAALSDRVPAAVRRNLFLSAPRGRIENILLSTRDGKHRGQARIVGLGWLSLDGRPAIEGLGGDLRLDQQGALFELDAPAMRFDWPRGFVAPLPFRAGGDVAIWRDADAGWLLGSPRLRVEGEDYAASLRFQLDFGGDGRPRIDLAADVDPGPAVAAKRFWVLDGMPEPAIDWLNTAIEDGRIAGGQAVLSGDLDDWPFRDGSGRFEAVAQLDGLALQFQPDWPRAENLSGVARFTGTGFTVEGTARLLDVTMTRVAGGIEDYREPWLRLAIDGEGGGAAMLEVLRRSPLRQRFGEQFGTLELGGAAKAALALDIPLKAALGSVHLRGTVDLKDAELRDPRWNLDFTGASGRVRFSETGFSAEELSVRLDEQVGSLSIAVGGYTSDPALQAEASLRGRFAVDSLLSRYEALGWLRPAMSGRSDWSIGLRVPAAGDQAEAPPPTLRIRSDLVGTALALPAPLRKEAGEPLRLTVETPLPVDAGELRVRLGELMQLRAHLREQNRLDGVLAFGDAPEPPDGARGLKVVGQVPVLDAVGWAAFASGQGGEGMIREIDLAAGEVDLLDRAFVETRLRVSRDDTGADVILEGPELDGRLRVPNDLGQGVEGNFVRLHWPSGRLARGTTTLDADPSLIPPLRFTVEDLRFGAARLGRTRLETYPTPEGLHVQRFEAESPSQRISAGGHWGRIDGQAYSRFTVDFNADSLGRMLDALGYAGMVEDGPTRARLVAGWKGSPAAFGLEAVQGRLELDMGPGRILEVEPGAGRVLGLVSLAELPRRLLLDFSDFLGQGLSFNSIKGSFALAEGRAVTDDLVIDGPAAEIRVRGSALLKAREYDQTIEVLPKTGGVLPVVGALAGGPAGAAVGAVAQAILQRPFKEISRTVYHVTGPWKAPKVEVVERGPARPDGAEAGSAEPAR